MSRLLRSLVLIVIGIAVAAAAVVLAPQCIGSPLANLDPLLRTMWLDNVTEARSIFKEMYYAPGTLGVFYACGLLAIVTCVYQIVRRQNAQRYAILLAMIGISWGVALVQIRGAALANLLSIVPLASMVAQLRARSMAVKTQTVSSFAYVALFLVSMPIGWVLIGDAVNAARALLPGAAINAEAAPAEVSDDVSCTKKADFAQISGLEPSIVATSVDVGAGLLRYTHHRTLSAPYHRNQGGMLAEIHIATSAPDEAEAFMRRAHVSIIALCPSDTGTKNLMRVAPDGFYAQLVGGRVPSFLEALPKDPSSGFILFRLKENGV